MDAETQQNIRIEMLYQEIKGIDDNEFEFPEQKNWSKINNGP